MEHLSPHAHLRAPRTITVHPAHEEPALGHVELEEATVN